MYEFSSRQPATMSTGKVAKAREQSELCRDARGPNFFQHRKDQTSPHYTIPAVSRSLNETRTKTQENTTLAKCLPG